MDEETAEALTRTKALYDAGVLTEEEFNAKKKELLSPPGAVAQPPANEHGGVAQGHVVAVQPQKVHPLPPPLDLEGALHRPAERRAAEHGRGEWRVFGRGFMWPRPSLSNILQLDDRGAARARRDRDVAYVLSILSSSSYRAGSARRGPEAHAGHQCISQPAAPRSEQ